MSRLGLLAHNSPITCTLSVTDLPNVILYLPFIFFSYLHSNSALIIYNYFEFVIPDDNLKNKVSFFAHPIESRGSYCRTLGVRHWRCQHQRCQRDYWC